MEEVYVVIVAMFVLGAYRCVQSNINMKKSFLQIEEFLGVVIE